MRLGVTGSRMPRLKKGGINIKQPVSDWTEAI